MNTCLIAFAAAFLVAIVCGGMALLLARLAIDSARRATVAGAKLQTGLEALATRIENLERLGEDLRRLPAEVPIESGSARSGLNLNRRAQVLRMHRRGDAPDRIASLLELPRQEVDLLIKVHRIVISQL